MSLRDSFEKTSSGPKVEKQEELLQKLTADLDETARARIEQRTQIEEIYKEKQQDIKKEVAKLRQKEASYDNVPPGQLKARMTQEKAEELATAIVEKANQKKLDVILEKPTSQLVRESHERASRQARSLETAKEGAQKSNSQPREDAQKDHLAADAQTDKDKDYIRHLTNLENEKADKEKSESIGNDTTSFGTEEDFKERWDNGDELTRYRNQQENNRGNDKDRDSDDWQR